MHCRNKYVGNISSIDDGWYVVEKALTTFINANLKLETLPLVFTVLPDTTLII